MTRVRQKLDENTLAALMHDAAQTKAKKRQQRKREGIERKPRESLWAKGVAHGLMVLEDQPAEAKRVLEHAKKVVSSEPDKDTADPIKADALHQRMVTYHHGIVFALSGSRIQAKFFARAAKSPKELVGAVAS